MTGIKDLLREAKSIRHRIVKSKSKFDEKSERQRAKSIESKAKHEADEVRRLDNRLEDLRHQEKKLKEREAIQNKKREIRKLEEKVTLKGRVMADLNRRATSLVKSASKEMKKKSRRKK